MTPLDSETAMIGCLLVQPSVCCDDAFSELSEVMFSDEGCREIFRICQNAYMEKNGVYDIASIVSKMNMKCRGLAMRYAETLPSVSNWKLYMQGVKDAYVTREAVAKANDLLKATTFGNPTVDELQAMAENIIKPFNGVKEAESTSASNAIDIFEREQKRVPQYFKFGIPTLDDSSFVESGDLIVIGGRPSAGKTAVSINFMMYMARNHKCVFFSFETRKEKIIDRMIAAYCGIPLSHIKRRALDDEDKKRWREAKAEFSKLNLEIVEAAGHTVRWVRNEAVKRGAEVVFVDYLTIVKSHGNGRYEMTTNAINELHVMAQTEKIVTVVLAQINRQAAAQAPTVADLKESGGIEEASDMILLLHNGYEDGYKMILGKNKEGRVGTIDCVFDAEKQTIRELGVDEDGFQDVSNQQLPF